MLTLLKSMSRSLQGHDLYIYCSTLVLIAACQVLLQYVQQFLQRRFLMVFTIYGHGGHLGHVTWFIYIQIGSPFIQMLPIKFYFDWPSGFKGEDL